MKRWYVIQVYTGFEEVVKADLEKRIVENAFEELFGQVLIPSSEVASFFSDIKNKKEKIFPGYLLICMEMTGDTFRLVSSTPRTMHFLGGSSPMALSKNEIDKIFSQMSGKIAALQDKSPFSIGHEVNIAHGPFAGFYGLVDKIDEEREKLTVMVSIFGRMTPVELGFDQVNSGSKVRR